MKYRLKPEEVDAFQIDRLVSVDGIPGNIGDYLVSRSGKISVILKEIFEAMFEEMPVGPTQKTFVIPLPAEKPSQEFLDQMKKEDEQTSVMLCFTCGEEVKASQVDAEKNCPKCSTATRTTKSKLNSSIGCCDHCGTPTFIDALNAEGLCKDCIGRKE